VRFTGELARFFHGIMSDTFTGIRRFDVTHQYIDVNAANVDEEHLCCAFSDAKHAPGTQAKRAWLKERFAEGLVFRKLDARAKVFIEYMPADLCWRPIVAPGWMAIHCLWVSGRYGGQGHARALLEHCMEDTRVRGLAGIVVATGVRKRPFLGDPKFFARFGFERVQRSGDYALWAWRIDDSAPEPRLADEATRQDPGLGDSMVIRHTCQCPLNPHWASEMAKFLRAEGVDVDVEHVDSVEDAQRVASPLGTFSLESEDGLVAHHLQTEGAVHRMVAKRSGSS